MLDLIAPLFLAFSAAEQIIGRGIVASRFTSTGLGCVVRVTPREKPDLRFPEDLSLGDFLRARCPALDVSVLE